MFKKLIKQTTHPLCESPLEKLFTSEVTTQQPANSPTFTSLDIWNVQLWNSPFPFFFPFVRFDVCLFVYVNIILSLLVKYFGFLMFAF